MDASIRVAIRYLVLSGEVLPNKIAGAYSRERTPRKQQFSGSTYQISFYCASTDKGRYSFSARSE